MKEGMRIFTGRLCLGVSYSSICLPEAKRQQKRDRGVGRVGRRDED